MRLNTGILERLRNDARSAAELGFRAKLAFHLARRTRAYRAAYEEPEPLVSICISTFNRARLLAERSVASSLAQTYPNIEVIVVGDGCTDETEAVMAGMTDPRLRFVNRDRRGDYAGEPELRWMMAGADAYNHALSLARGSFITHLDDDDTHAPDRVEKLVAFAKVTRADLIFHPFTSEAPDGTWEVNPAERLLMGRVTSSSIFYHRWFARYPADKASILRFREPGDWNRLRKIRYLGARIRRHPDVMLKHFRERGQYGR
jgi:glycosyltransferase involved in cell wall biosynthesis